MLEELRIRNLGVIEDVELVLPAGSIAVTGETGAGKTMIVGAIQLLLGGRAEPDMVRVGADEAVVEGRFVDHSGEEVVVRRVIPASGRSRAYIDGSLATASGLQDRIGPLVDLHGQHSQQTLLRPATQRSALDTYAHIDTVPLADARESLRSIDTQLAELGGDATERARRIDLLRYQLDELANAQISDPDEDQHLEARETILASAFDDRLAAGHASELLGGDGPVAEGLGVAATHISSSPAFEGLETRLAGLQEELADVASELRRIAETTVDDPEAREGVRARRQLLSELRRKYGPTLADVMTYEASLSDQLAQLESHEERVVALTDQRAKVLATLRAESARVLAERTAAAPKLAQAVQDELVKLAMPSARVSIAVEGEAGEDVAILLAPNPGLPELPVGKGASGGELSRTMLAIRLVIAGGPPIKVFDEVDAGIGGETGKSIGEALAELGEGGQVFVVTHLAQVAACAGHHIVIDKSVVGQTTSSEARLIDPEQRVVELSRMLSGSPNSEAARQHAEELLGSRTTDQRAR